jgi:protein-tyrosine-phosphatase
MVLSKSPMAEGISVSVGGGRPIMLAADHTKPINDENGNEVIVHYPGQFGNTLNFSDYENYDYLIAMDTNNVRNIMRIIGSDKEEKVFKLMSFTSRGGDVADPWYTGDFEQTYQDVLAGCKGLLTKIKL